MKCSLSHFRKMHQTRNEFSTIEKIFNVLGFIPHKEQREHWSLKWTYLQIIIHFPIAIWIINNHRKLLAQYDYLSTSTDVIKVISLFLYTSVVYVEVLFKYKNYYLLDEIISKIDKILLEMNVTLSQLKIKIRRRFLVLSTIFFTIYIVVNAGALVENLNESRKLLFLYLVLYPQLLKFLRPFQFIFYITQLLIYLECVSHQINRNFLTDKKLRKLFEIHKLLEDFFELFIKTVKHSMLAYICQESLHIFTDFYFIIFFWILGGETIFWTVSVSKALLFYQVFYNGQLYINLVIYLEIV